MSDSEEESWDDEALLREIEAQLEDIETDEEEEREVMKEERKKVEPRSETEEMSEAWRDLHDSIARSNVFIENVDRETKEVTCLLSPRTSLPMKIEETDSESNLSW